MTLEQVTLLEAKHIKEGKEYEEALDAMRVLMGKKPSLKYDYPIHYSRYQYLRLVTNKGGKP